MPSHPYEILVLDQPGAASQSLAAHQPVLWISRRPPQQVLGALGRVMEGAWYEPGKVVVSLHGQTLVHPVTPPAAGDVYALLTSTLALHLAGVSPNAIQNQLSPTNHQPAIA